MSMHWRRGAICLGFFLAGLSGCHRATVPAPEPEDATRLGTSVEISLKEWQDLPRAELAKKAAEVRDAAATLQQSTRQTEVPPGLLPDIRCAISPPLLGESKFSEAAGFSIPPYYKPGTYDAELALHFARYGDREAAMKVADPNDKELRTRIEALYPDHGYAVEWTQLVGLHLQLAQLKLAHGEPADALEGAAELVLLHKQLGELLDPKAAAGPLGAALLGVGKNTLGAAAKAYREPDLKKNVLADDIDGALRDWGTVPATASVYPPGTPATTVAAALGSEVQNRTIVAQSANELDRTLDLVGLPVIREDMQNIVAFLDDKGKLAELLYVYKVGIKLKKFPNVADIGRPFANHGFTGDTATNGLLPRQSFTGSGLVCEVAMTPRSQALGAFIRVGAANTPPATSLTRDPRDFGTLHLDRSFEANRSGASPDLTPDKKLTITKPAALERITTPIKEPLPVSVVVNRNGEQEIVEDIFFHWNSDLNLLAVPKLAVPLWIAYGPARIESQENTASGGLLFIWENQKTRLTLKMPYDTKDTIDLSAADSRGDKALQQRMAETTKFDRKERNQRWKDGQPVSRIVSNLPGETVENLELGQSRAAARKILSQAPDGRLTTLPDGGYNLLLFSHPYEGVTFWPRQVFVRFDGEDKVAEIRVRYDDGSTKPSKKNASLLDALKANHAKGAAPEKPVPTWSSVWTDLRGSRPATYFRWIDDKALLTYQRDAMTTEVTLRACTQEDPQGVDLPPLAFCSRGIKGCELGDRRNELLEHWKIDKPVIVGDALLIAPSDGLYDALLVYFDGPGKEARVIKIQAQFRKRIKAGEVEAEISEAWSSDIDHLGSLRAKHPAFVRLLPGSSWHDDRTRVRIFGQETETGPRLYCEWRELPIQQLKTVKQF